MTTIGDLTPNMIGRDRIKLGHEGSTIYGRLNGLDTNVEAIYDGTFADTFRTHVITVDVTVTLGSITIGPLNRDHPCEIAPDGAGA